MHVQRTPCGACACAVHVQHQAVHTQRTRRAPAACICRARAHAVYMQGTCSVPSAASEAARPLCERPNARTCAPLAGSAVCGWRRREVSSAHQPHTEPSSAPVSATPPATHRGTACDTQGLGGSRARRCRRRRAPARRRARGARARPRQWRLPCGGPTAATHLVRGRVRGRVRVRVSSQRKVRGRVSLPCGGPTAVTHLPLRRSR
eukprot:scaffold82535_cov95-Phaeocystis_antarctica.AAC.2